MSTRIDRAWRQAGVTLVELMVVVIMIGILATTAVVMVSSDPSAEDIAHRISGFIAEGSRRAIAGGAASDGTALTRVGISGLAGGQVLVIERYDEASGNWEIISDYSIPNNVDVVGFRLAAEMQSAMPDHILATGEDASLMCYPDGSCTPENAGSVGMTIYVREIRRPTLEARVVVLPLGGMPLVYDSW